MSHVERRGHTPIVCRHTKAKHLNTPLCGAQDTIETTCPSFGRGKSACASNAVSPLHALPADRGVEERVPLGDMTGRGAGPAGHSILAEDAMPDRGRNMCRRDDGLGTNGNG